MSTLKQSAFEQWTARRDAEAFQALMERHARMVLATSRRILRNDTEAEDITLECFEALATAERGQPRELGAWLHGMAVNKCRMRIRAEGRRKEREARYAATQQEHVENHLDDVYLHVDEAIAALPEDIRAAVVAHYLCGQSHREIARDARVSRRTISRRIETGVGLIGERLRAQGITMPAAALAAFLGSNLSEAVTLPVQLASTLGKLALAHSANAAVVSGSALGVLASALFAKKAIVAVAVLSAIVGGVWIAQKAREQGRTPPAQERLFAEQDPPGDSLPAAPAGEPPLTATAALAPGSSEGGLPAITGTARYLESGAPVPGVHVRLHSVPPDAWVAEAFTDAHGEFRFPDLTTDTHYSLKAWTDEKGYGAIVDRNGIWLKPGELRAGVDIIVATGGTISGKVLDKSVSYFPAGIGSVHLDPSAPNEHVDAIWRSLIQVADKPLAGVAIVLAKTRVDGKRDTPLLTAVTADDGQFVLSGFPPGKYDVWAEPPEDAVRFEPNHKEQFRTVTAERGGQLEVDFSFRFDGIAIAGNVKDSRGTPLEAVKITAAPLVGGNSAYDESADRLGPGTVVTSAVSGDSGAYRLEGLCPADIRSAWQYLTGYHLPGSFVLRAEAEGYAPAEITVPAVTDNLARSAKESLDNLQRLMARAGLVDDDRPASPIETILPKSQGDTITNVDFVLEPEAVVAGRLVDTTGQALPKVMLEILFAGGSPTEYKALVSQTPPPDWMMTDEAGRFRFAKVPSGSFVFETDAPPVGRRRAVNAPLEVRSGASIVDLEVVVEAPEDRGTISGSILEAHSGKAVPEFQVDLKTEKSGTSHHFKDGALLIESVYPGPATLKLRATGFATEVAEIDVAAGRVTTVNLQLVEEGILEGYVTLNGGPSAHGYITAWYEDEAREASSWAQPDAQGYYKLGALKPGNYRVRTTMWLYEDERGGAQVSDVAWVRVPPGTVRVDVEYHGDCAIHGTFAGPEDLGWRVRVDDNSLPRDDQLRAIAFKFEKQGAYEIGSLPPGNYTVVAQCFSRDESGSTVQREQSQAVSLAAGEIAEVDFDLR
ncbi:MAG: sigma-70 family RNA polymerase sigma factor [Candidatus Hydrogenedentes bacterium]|nr:sigma-70 family RNA polymerase sigma factor [Candidatus Hydrogenedentota bacterium]